KMCGDALAQIDALADVQRQRIQAVEAIYARCFGNMQKRVRRQLRWQAGCLEHACDRSVDFFRRLVAIQRLDELPEDAGIAECAMTVSGMQRVPRDERS